MLVRYEDDDASKPIVLMAKGNGGLVELHSHLNEDSVAYGFLRMVRPNAQLSRIIGHCVTLSLDTSCRVVPRGRPYDRPTSGMATSTPSTGSSCSSALA